MLNMVMHGLDAIHNFKAAKLRSALAVLGVLIGTASVVAMVLSGQLATYQVLEQFKALGTDLLAVSASSVSTQEAKQPLSVNWALNLKQSSPMIKLVAPYTHTYLPVSFRGQSIESSVVGATEELAEIAKLSISQGRFVSYLDRYMPFCVVGSAVYQQLTAMIRNPLGEQLQIGGTLFTIVGVIDPWEENSFIYTDLNRSVFIPILASFVLDERVDIRNFVMRLTPHADIEQVKQQIGDYFANQNTGKKLYFRSAKQFIQGMIKQRKVLTILLGLIGGVSLLVGGIGIMNIMLVSVSERRQEIGIRFAVGAKRKDIQTLFLVEAILLSVTGGCIGILLGILITSVMAWYNHWTFVLFVTPIIIGFGVSVLTGVFFGFYPAYTASRLQPIEILRSE